MRPRGSRTRVDRPSPFLTGSTLGRSHRGPAPFQPGLRAAALGPGGRGLRRGLGGQSCADPRLSAPGAM
jgi:hypothetical protein